MSLSQITALLRETLGLDVASVGVSLIERAVKRRVNAHGLRDVSQYADLLQRSPPELQNLFEAVVIPETFFFRYPESFAALQQFVGEHIFFGTQKLRALSIPCSTGEEPYSIAMTLLDAGWSLEKFQIDAIDVSTHLLDIARLGLFGSNSFRGSELQFRKQYFHKTEAGFQLCDRVRQCVNFDPKELKGVPATVAKARATYFKGLLLWQNKSVGCLNDQLLFEMLDESLT
jgi:chemotaxis protein methyltransferase WspC